MMRWRRRRRFSTSFVCEHEKILCLTNADTNTLNYSVSMFLCDWTRQIFFFISHLNAGTYFLFSLKNGYKLWLVYAVLLSMIINIHFVLKFEKYKMFAMLQVGSSIYSKEDKGNKINNFRTKTFVGIREDQRKIYCILHKNLNHVHFSINKLTLN